MTLLIRLWNYFMERTSPENPGKGGELDFWRERVVRALYLAGTAAGTLAYLPMMYFLIKRDLWPLVIFDSLMVVWGYVVLIFQRRISASIRFGAVVLVTHAIGLLVLVELGPFSGGTIWLFASSVSAGLLLGNRAALASVLLNAFSLTVLGWFVRQGLPSWTALYGDAAARWLNMSLNFLVVNALVTTAAAVLLKGLSQALKKQEDVSSLLEAEREGLRDLNRRLETEARAHQLANLALNSAEERFQAFMDSLEAITYATDIATDEIIFANKATVEFLGHDPRGQTCWRALHGGRSGPCDDCNKDLLFAEGGVPAKPIDREVYNTTHQCWLAARDTGVIWPDGRRARLVTAFDITERKTIQQELAKSQEMFLKVLDASPMGLQVFELQDDGSLIFTHANRAADVITGLEHAELVGLRLEDAFPATKGTEVPRRYRQVATEGSTWNTEWVNRKDGAVDGAVELHVFQIQPGRAAALFLDITERFLAREALEASEEKHRLVVENAGEAILVVQDGLTKFFNRRAVEMSGYSEEQYRRMSFLDLTHPDDRIRALEYYQRRMSGEAGVPRFFQLRGMHASGEERWLEINSVAVPWEGKPATLVFVNDVTERMETEQALRESEERYRGIFESTVHAISLVSWPDGQFLDVNLGWCRETGFSREEALGFNVADLAPHMSRADMKAVVAQLRESGVVESRAMRFLRKDGSVLDTIYTARLVRYMGRECVLTVVQDITRMREAEREQARLQAQLQQSQKMEAVGTLAGGVAHDFNNILQAIRGYAHLLSLKEHDAEARRDYLAQIMAAAERASDLVQRMLTFSRKVEPSLKPLDPNEEVRQAARLLELTIPKMVSIRTEPAPGLGFISGDATQLEQVLINLGKNAADAMPEGGELVIQTMMTTLDETFCRQHAGTAPGRYVELRVSDTGKGMDAETLAHIFEPFFTTKEIGKGTGLGLSMVYGIIDGHKGHILCQSTPGQGTVFRIFLPVLEHQAARAYPEEQAASEIQGGQETILVVDDEPSVLATAQEMLAISGYQVITAQSGEQALETYRTAGRPVDLVILDLGMPGMGGRKALECLKEKSPEIKVIIASGYSFQDSEHDLLEAGASRVLAKPYHYSELLNNIRQVLDQ